MAAIAWLLLETFIHKWSTLPSTNVDLRGRVVVITGANVGLGFEAAKAFYKMNPERLIIACRSTEKGEAAKKEILSLDKGNTGAVTKIEVWKLDLSEFDSVKAFAAKCESELERIDVFLSNAAGTFREWSQTKDGWESAIQVNVISNFLLCSLLVPLISKTAKLPAPNRIAFRPHLVVVTSDAHVFAGFPERNSPEIFQSLNDKAHFNGRDRYAVTKTLDLLLTRQLAKSPAVDPGVVVCSVNPGLCRSELMRSAPALLKETLYALFARTGEEGAKTYLWACLTDDIPPGSYTSSCTVTTPSSFLPTDEGLQVQKKAWKELTDIVVKIAPETKPIWGTI